MNSTNTMTLGSSTFLVVLGAIMRYATNWQSAYVDIDMIGGILMLAGLLGAAVSIVLFAVSRRSMRTGAHTATTLETRETREVL